MRSLILAVGLAVGLSFAATGSAAAQPTGAPEADHTAPEHKAGPIDGGGEGHEAGEAHHDAHGAAHHDPTHDFNWTKIHYGKDIKGGPMGDNKLGDQPLAPGEKEEPMSGAFIFMVLNFALLLVILIKAGGPAARKMAESRSDQIKTALDEAGRLRDQAKAKLDEYNTKLADADAEIKKMIDGIRADAEADRERVMAAAEAQAVALKKEADERIAVEIARARHELGREVAVAAALATEKLLATKTTAADQTKLVDGFISDLGGSAATRQERS
jgi:F-type H+-transporting ATPase subunit b